MPAGTPRRVSRDAAGHIPPSGQRQFRPEIDGLRALAVVIVVASRDGVITCRDDNHLTAADASFWRRFAHVLSVARPPHSI